MGESSAQFRYGSPSGGGGGLTFWTSALVGWLRDWLWLTPSASAWRRQFASLELDILLAVLEHVSPDVERRLVRQLQTINKVQRSDDGREVTLYRLRRGKIRFDKKLRFPRTRDVTMLASAVLIHPQGNIMQAEMFMAQGRVFSIKFDKVPAEFLASPWWRPVRAKVTNVRIWFDPSRPHASRPLDELALRGWMEDQRAEEHVVLLFTPLSTHRRVELMVARDTRFPPDYDALMAQSDGVWLTNAWVFGMESMRRIEFDGATYFALAEVQAGRHGALAVQEGNHDGLLFFLDYDRDAVLVAGASMQQTLGEYMAS